MNNKKSTKRTLVSSVLSLVLCMAMLIGTTFAWFTDSVTSSNNKIQSGTLEIDLELLEKDGTWTSLKDENKAIFNWDKWEPGYTDVKILKIKNEGTLAVKWMAKFVSENQLTILADVIDVYVNTSVTAYPTDRDDLAGWTKVGTVRDFVNQMSETTQGTLLAGAEAPLGIALKMQESAGNEYQGLSLGGTFDIRIFATQMEAENDSFGIDYDKNAWMNEADTTWYDAAESTYEIRTAAELAGVAKIVNEGNSLSGKTVKIMNDINLNNADWTPIGVSGAPFGGTLEGQGYTIYNLNVEGTNGVGLVGVAGNATSIYNVNITNATVTGTHYVGAVLGYGYLAKDCLKGCTVTNATITCKPELINGVYDNGDKAGVIAGWAANGNITKNKAVNSTVKAYRDFGGIVGCAQAENRAITVESNTVENVSLSFITVDKYAGNKPNQNAGEVVGRLSEGTYKVTVGDNTVEDTTIEATPVSSQTALVDALKKGEDVKFAANVEAEAAKGGYSVAGLTMNGNVIDGNGKTLNVENANGTWDCAIYTQGGTVKNLIIGGAFRGIFTAGCSSDIIIDSCVLDNVCYTISSDGFNPNYSIIVTNTTLNGWTSYIGGYKSVSFTDCKFGKGTGGYQYAYCRPYSETTFTNCVFEVGYEFDASKTTNTFVNCYVGDTLITADNIVELLGTDAANAVVK